MIFAPGANAYPIVNYEYAIVNSTSGRRPLPPPSAAS